MMLSGEIAFVGSWQEAGFKDLASWTSDEVTSTNEFSSINFYFIDELEELESRPTFVQGTVKSVLGWFGVQS